MRLGSITPIQFACAHAVLVLALAGSSRMDIVGEFNPPDSGFANKE